MYFKESNEIRRETDFTVADIRKVDEYLARPNRKTFDLWSLQSHTGLDDTAAPILNEFRKRSVVSKPELRYLCPVHETILNPGVWRSVRCIDCGISYRRTDCQTNLFLNRIKNPEKWPPSKGPTIYHPPPEREPPLWKDRRFLIPIILFVLHLPLTFYLHFNPYSPPENAKTLAASAVTSESYVTEQIPDVTTSKSPSSSSATLDANPISSSTVAATTITPLQGN